MQHYVQITYFQPNYVLVVHQKIYPQSNYIIYRMNYVKENVGDVSLNYMTTTGNTMLTCSKMFI